MVEKTTFDEKVNSSKNVLICALIAIGGIISGYDLGSIAGMFEMPKYAEAIGDIETGNSTWTIPAWKSGLIIGGATFSGLFGCLAFGTISDRLGRRLSLVIATSFIILASISQAVFHRFWVVVFASRLVSGFNIGGLSAVCPTYIGEVASGPLRPFLVSSYQLLLTIGILLGEIVAFGCSYWEYNSGQYLVTLLIIVIFALVLLTSIVFIVPESALFLVEKGKLEQAYISVSKATGLSTENSKVIEQIELIQNSVNSNRESGSASIKEFFSFKNRIFYRLALGISIQMLQQFTGINYFFYYGTSLFKEISTMNPFASTVILGTINVVGTFVCLPIVAKFPRRVVLMTGSFFMFLAFVFFSSLGTFALYNNEGNIITVVGIIMIILSCIFVVAYAGSWAPVAFLVVSEMFPARLRGTAISISVSASWLVAAILTFISPELNQIWGYKVGYIHTAFTLISFFIVYFFVFETRGLSLEEVEEMVATGISARKSPSWVGPNSRKEIQGQS